MPRPRAYHSPSAPGRAAQAMDMMDDDEHAIKPRPLAECVDLADKARPHPSAPAPCRPPQRSVCTPSGRGW